jgi:predicted CXXCH cytochrome family protein
MRLAATVSKVSKWLIFILLVSIVTGASGCSVKKHYKTLKVFFDGVPDPEEVKRKAAAEKARRDTRAANIAAADASRKNQAQTWVKMKSRHPDYFKNVCNRCHDRRSGNFMVTRRKEDICYTCHKKEQFTGPYVHGPVAVNHCLTCHLPHESPHASLLIEKSPGLCIACHTPDTETAAGHYDKARNCTKCHLPHAGDNRFFVKTGVSR